MKLSKYEKALYFEIFVKKEYGILNDVITNSDIVFDVGAHLGFFSLYCLKQNSNLKIHLFEPVSEYYKKAKVILKDYSSNTFFNNYGIYSSNCKLNVFINQEKSMQSSIFTDNFINKSMITRECDFITLEKYIIKHGIDRIDLLKMDIEGSEFDVMLSLERSYLSLIKNLFIEYHLIDSKFINSLNLILEQLKAIYKQVFLYESNYSNKLGYIYAIS